MSGHPKVSVIVPAYNTASYIGETMESIARQTFRDFETIVVNDGSPDTPQLERVLEPYRADIRYIRQPNRGLAGARNAGIAEARGEYLAFLDSDDAWEPSYLDVQLAEMERKPVADVVYPNATAFAPDGTEWLAMDRSPSQGLVTFESVVRQTCQVQVFSLVRRSLVVEAGGFDESLRSSEDFDLWLRLLKGGAEFRYHTQPLVRYRVRPDSLSADTVWMCDHVLKVLGKAAAREDLTSHERSAVTERQRYYMGMKRLYEGKDFLDRRKYGEARLALRQANDLVPSWKARLAGLGLRIWPAAVRSMARKDFPS